MNASTSNDHESDDTQIVRFEGNPNDSGETGERSIWSRFLNAIWPFSKRGGEWAKYSGGLGKAFAEAEVSQRANTAARTAAEAAETAARADVSRQEAVRVFNEQIDAIFGDDGLPESAKLLKLAKLLEKNTDLSEQIENVTEIIDRLALTRGSKIKIGATSRKMSTPRGGS